ncbi:Esterase EstB [Ruegeria sp. THAF57]|uniref:serine hydrolase domain-containing protein n=1 Tax=Ruegeria sp. THAF57 TaxID=2744555 RepID=UPI0015DD93B3|nr:serine hydrolase domain-containing protein [Ruegeria sp. THAF57]CAD0183919.1 Esterase EstB [Ruegeria sp. THAF57]
MSEGFDLARLERIRPWMQSYIEARKYPGASVLVRRNGTEVFYADCGLRNIEEDLPFTRETIARIYSMTKPVTSVALMTLVERGLIHLGAPVSEFIPGFAQMQALIPGAIRLDQTEPASTPTLQQLLTHTSGLSYSFNPGLVAEAMADQRLDFTPKRGTLAEVADKVAALPLAFQPGARWMYSVGIDIAGRVVEVVSGKTLDQFFDEEIFQPLDMTETAFNVPADAGDRFANLYTPLDDPMALNAAKDGGDTLRLADDRKTSSYHTTKQRSGGGGLVGTIDDYMKFTEMLRRGGDAGDHRILSTKTLAFMMSNHLKGDIAEMGIPSFAEQPMVGTGFGIGGSVTLNPGRVGVPGSVGDFAWGGMASTAFWVDPVHQMSVVFFTQLSPSSSYPSRAQLRALIHGALIE